MVKECFLEQAGQQIANEDQLPLVVESAVKSKPDEITLPPILAENNHQLLTDVRPKDFDQESRRGPAVNVLEPGVE